MSKLYRTGEAPDGTVFYSFDDRTPVDDTPVFVAGRPNDLMTVMEAEERFGEVVWLMEPVPMDPREFP